MTPVAPTVRFHLSPPQKAVYVSPAQRRVAIAGRRGGKSFVGALCLLDDATKGPNRVCWYVAPTYRQGKDILWQRLREVIPAAYVLKRNETDLTVHLLNGSVIAIKGVDVDPDKLRGVGIDFVALDEFDQMQDGHKKIWEAIIAPSLAMGSRAGHGEGKALFITTPKGLNWAYDLYLKGQEQRDGFASWKWTTLEGGLVKPEVIDAARASHDPRLFRQEYEASFEVLEGRVYDCFDRVVNVEATLTDPGAEILVGMDFNVNPMSCVIGVQAGEELHVLDALEVPTSNTEELATELQRRYPGRRLIVCPDPSAKARRTSAAAGVTDLSILEAHGFLVDISYQTILIPDRVNAVQAMLKDGAGRRRLRVHPRASLLIRALDGQTYKPGTSLPDKTSGLDHVNDALGYLVWQRFNLLQSNRATTSTFYT